ncbi:hypothetical protein H0E84_02040 [Luteimonas sp. SJ-92]|uniref:IPT/TIG domain-containing protein n=1 Tax=Luteimonas salinisoli TaxID=2752307 RepID=A0A853J8P8_9GAMM|nr:hypothetical protein [Luteimonas salinisoli]NZA25152.1 hypothetical protein [Luteimonas salinisoli]
MPHRLATTSRGPLPAERRMPAILRGATPCHAAWIFTWVAVAVMAVLVSPATAQTHVSGPVAVDTQWTADESPYLLSGDVQVQSGAVLKIEAGVIVYMGAAAGLAVEAGSIEAAGTNTHPIQVLSDKTRTGEVAAAGDYREWSFNSGDAGSRLEHMIFEHGSGLVVQGASPVFNHLDIRNHQGPAIRIDLDSSPSGVGNRASGNTLNGISVPAGDILGSARWALRGIPYVIESGAVSVGASPEILGLTPDVLVEGETTEIVVSGTRLGGVTQARTAVDGVQLQIVPGGTDTQLAISVAVPESADAAVADLELLASAGWVGRAEAFAIQGARPVLVAVDPQSVYLGQPDPRIEIEGRNLRAESILLLDGVEIPSALAGSTTITATLPTQTAVGSRVLQLRTPDPESGGEPIHSNELSLTVLAAEIRLPDALSLLRGETRQVRLEIPYPAPPGGFEISLLADAPAYLGVPSTVTVVEGQLAAEFAAEGLDSGSGSLVASADGFEAASLAFEVVQPPALSLSVDSDVFLVDQSYQLQVAASSVAGAEGIALQLTSSDPAVASVPVAATIPAGEQQTMVTMTTASSGSTSVGVAAAGFEPGVLEVTVRSDLLHLPSGVWVEQGVSRSIPLNIGSPAPAGGLVVELSSSHPDALAVPSSVTIQEGQMSADVDLSAFHDSHHGTVSITAIAEGYAPITVPATVLRAAWAGLLWDSVPYHDDLYVAVGENIDYTFRVGEYVPQEDVTFTLVSSDTAIFISNPNATLTQANGGVGTVAFTGVAAGEAQLTLNAPGLREHTMRVIVLQDPEVRFQQSEMTVGIGMRTVGSVALYENGAPYINQGHPILVRFTSESSAISISQGELYPGSTSFSFDLHGPDTALAEPAVVQVAVKGFAPANSLSVTAVKPQLQFRNLSLERYVGDAVATGELYMAVPGDESGTIQRLRHGTSVGLSLTDVDGDTGVSLLDPSVSWSPGQESVQVRFGSPASPGSYSVTATSPAADSVTAGPVVVTVSEFQLVLTDWSWSSEALGELVLGEGMTRSGYVARWRNGSPDPGVEPLTINLRCVPIGACTVSPQTVVIPANQRSIGYAVSHAPGYSGAAPVVEAVAEGYPALSVPVSLVALRPRILELSTSRTTASAADGFKVRLGSASGEQLEHNTPTAPLAVDFEIVDDAPSGLVPGFLVRTAQGEPPQPGTSILLDGLESFGDYWSDDYAVSVATPQSAGSYRIRATLRDGGASVTSNTVIVSGEVALEFGRSQLLLGRGMRQRVWIERTSDGQPVEDGPEQAVTWSCVPSSVCGLDGANDFHAGSSSASVEVQGLDLTGATPARLLAGVPGYPPAEIPLIVVEPSIEFEGLSPFRDLGAPDWDRFDVRLRVPDPSLGSQQVMPGFQVELELVDASPADVVDGIAGSDQVPTASKIVGISAAGSAFAYVAPPNVAGTYRIRASVVAAPVVNGVPIDVQPVLSGLVEARDDTYMLEWGDSEVVVGLGMTRNVVVRQMRNGNPYSADVPKTIHLGCAPSSACGVPASVSIPPHQSSVSVPLQGLALADGSVGALLTARPDGYGSDHERSVAVQVVAPALRLSGVSTERYVATVPSPFYLAAGGPGGEHIGATPSEWTFSWELVNADPAGIVAVVDYVWDGGAGSYEPVEELSLPASYYLSSPTAPGAYRLKISGHGMEVVSDSVTVLADGPRELRTWGDLELDPWQNEDYPAWAFVGRLIGGQEHMPAEALTVAVSCESDWGCSVPATTTIPAGQSGVEFEVRIGNGEPGDEGVIHLQADGYPPASFRVFVPLSGGS